MKSFKRIMIVFVGLLCLAVALPGCGKSESSSADKSTAPTAPKSDLTGSGAVPTVDAEAMKKEAEKVVKAVAASVEEDLKKSVAEIKKQVADMPVEQIKETALKYKKLLTQNEDKLKGLMASLKEIPALELLGAEAKKLQSEIDTISKSVKNLKDRFDVYYKKLVDTKADLTGLK